MMGLRLSRRGRMPLIAHLALGFLIFLPMRIALRIVDAACNPIA